MDGEAGLDIKNQRSLVVKVDGKRVVIACGKQLDSLGDFPFNQRKFDEAPVGKRPFMKGKVTR